jgi:hypothetical protein
MDIKHIDINLLPRVYKCNVSIPLMLAIWGSSSDLSCDAADEKFSFCLIDAQPLEEAVRGGGRGMDRTWNVNNCILVDSLQPRGSLHVSGLGPNMMILRMCIQGKMGRL